MPERGFALEQKRKQKRFDASAYTNRQIEQRARTALKERPRQGDTRSKQQRLDEEIKVQAQLYKEEKAAVRQQRTLQRQEKSVAAKAQADARLQRDMAWGAEHEADTDEALLAYVRSCAESLGHTPYAKEVLGGEYIRSRFVSWSIALQAADLLLPGDMKPPTKKMLAAFKANRGKNDY